MPLAIDEEKMKAKMSMDLSAPQGSPSGIPVKSIPILEYPRCVYKHPRDPFKRIEHRNANFEVVHVETVPAEAMGKAVADEAELNAALADGWVKEPYVPKAPPDPNENLYVAAKPVKAEKAGK